MAHKLKCDKCGSDNIRKATRKYMPHTCRACYHGFYPVHRYERAKAAGQYVANNAGKSESGISDTNDCAVRAAAIAMGIKYSDAHTLFDMSGRVKFQGTSVWTIEKAWQLAEQLGMVKRVIEVKKISYNEGDGGIVPAKELERSDDEREVEVNTRWGCSRTIYRTKYRTLTMARMRNFLANGRFVVCSRHHAFAVINGVVHDGAYQGPGVRVCQIYQVEPA